MHFIYENIKQTTSNLDLVVTDLTLIIQKGGKIQL